MGYPLPPHVWFVRGHYWGDGYTPATRQGWLALAGVVGLFMTPGIAIVVLSLAFPRHELLWFVCGGVAFLLILWRLRDFFPTHGDLSISIEEYRALRDEAERKR